MLTYPIINYVYPQYRNSQNIRIKQVDIDIKYYRTIFLKLVNKQGNKNMFSFN